MGSPLLMPPSMPPARLVRRAQPARPAADLVVHRRCRACTATPKPAPISTRLDGLDAHHRRRQRGVEARVPLGGRAEARWACPPRRRRTRRRSSRPPRRARRSPRIMRASASGRGSAAGWGRPGRSSGHPKRDAVERVVGVGKARTGPSWSTKLQMRTPAAASSWRQTAPARTRTAVERADARSSTSRMSSVSYLMAPARSAWPGRASVTALGRPRAGQRLGRHAVLPVLPVAVLDAEGERRAERPAEAQAGRPLDLVLLDEHAPAAAVAVLAPAQVAVDLGRSRRAARRAAPRGCRYGGTVRLARGQQAQPSHDSIPMQTRVSPERRVGDGHAGGVVEHDARAPRRSRRRRRRPWRCGGRRG